MKRVLSLILILLLAWSLCSATWAETAVLPTNLNYIGEAAFQGDTSLDTVVIPEGVTEIPALAFAGSSIRAIYLPGTLVSIAANAFQGCTSTHFYVKTKAAYDWAVMHGFPAEFVADKEYHIGIITGSADQSEDELRGAQAIQARYGKNHIILGTYADDFTRDIDTTIQTIVNMSDDPQMKAIIVNQAVPGTTEAFRQIKERRPDILCFAGEAHEDLREIGAAADLVVSNDFIARGYLLVHTAHELGCDTFVHISFPRHMSYQTMIRRVAIMKAACEEFGMKFVLETAPDPTTSVGVAGAQAYVLEHVPQWIRKYGEHAAFFCTNDAHIEPLIKQLLKYGGYFIESDLPSPALGYPGALGLDMSVGDVNGSGLLARVEAAVVEQDGAGRFGTWAYSYGYTVSAGLARHAIHVICGESSPRSMADIARAFEEFTPGAAWNGSRYTTADGNQYENILLVYQDTYIMDDPGYYMGTPSVTVPTKYFTIK